MPANVFVAIPLTPRGAGSGGKQSVTTTSSQTAAIAADFVDLTSDAACFVELGADPTAVVNTSYYLPANVPIRFKIINGDKIAAITATGSANLYWHPVGFGGN